jgi:iron complex transport system permease protein
VFQGLLRNPLATPFTLGVSAGAALGAMLAITFSWSFAWAGVSAAAAASFIGSLAAVGIVYALARARHHGLSTNVLLLAGVTMNAFFSALILFVQYFADFSQTFRILRWLMGDLDISSYQPILTALPLVVISFAAFAWLARPLNLLSMGGDSAGTRGLNVVGVQRAAFLSASLATGAAVSVGGPVGVHRHHRAHLVRLIVGPDRSPRAPRVGTLRCGVLVGYDVLANGDGAD